jgi:hypothetical protein
MISGSILGVAAFIAIVARNDHCENRELLGGTRAKIAFLGDIRGLQFLNTVPVLGCFLDPP